MKLHIVGGFLGSGKTTAITNGARWLIQQGTKVAVITNDQGKYLVDTSFIDSNDIPTAEVTNGCFCCNFDNLSEQINLLEDRIHPEYIFAESVGSCTDLVATVLKPLQLLKKELFDELTFSVFADSRLLLDYLLGKKLAFSDAISYIFEKQIEEADLLIINKIDLLSDEDLMELQSLAEVRLNRKILIFQNTLNQVHIQHWISTLETLPKRRRDSLDIDYQIYGKGEAEMAWLDEEINIQTDDFSAMEQALIFIGLMIDEIKQREISIGHLKFLLKGDGFSHKISFTTIFENDWKIDLPVLNTRNILIMINSRIETTPESACEIVNLGISAISVSGVSVTVIHEQAFQPGFPNPTHRITGKLACGDECRCIKNLDNHQNELCLCECNLGAQSCCSF
jgi:Ni2+-binding GTPase involved in maturation of urease and hydrogenase